MQKLNLKKTLSNEKHECHSYREGDWILFICPDCDYVRQINYKTKKTVSTGGNDYVIHAGMHQPSKEESLKIN